MTGYWEAGHLLLDDRLNATIWAECPGLQRQIQPPETLTAVGSIGPQQAMLEEHRKLGITPADVLPWVPDLVGREWESPDAVLVYGAAYAGFIREYSTRRASMPIAEYWEAAGMGERGLGQFQETFLRHVVRPDRSYYGRIAGLLKATEVHVKSLVLSDLCPLSLVMRTFRNGRRADDSRQPTGERGRAFHDYLQHPTVRAWTVQRIMGSGSGRIVALGNLAEHGLLRLFRSLGAEISWQGMPWQPEPIPEEEPWAWVNHYAEPRRGLWFWLNHRTWWAISMLGRQWRLLPVYHPASVPRRDQAYRRTTKVMKQFLAGAD